MLVNSNCTHPKPKTATTVAESWSLWAQTGQTGSEYLSVLGMWGEFPTFPSITPTAPHLHVPHIPSAKQWAVGIHNMYQHNHLPLLRNTSAVRWGVVCSWLRWSKGPQVNWRAFRQIHWSHKRRCSISCCDGFYILFTQHITNTHLCQEKESMNEISGM